MIYKLNKLLFAFLFFSSIIGYAQEGDAKRKYDSLSRTGSIKNDRPKPTSFLFDSLFVVSDKYLKKNTKLTKTMIYAKLIYDSNDSSAFYVKTDKTVFLNGALLKQHGHYIIVDQCARSSIRVLSQKSLMDKYGVQNLSGGYIIDCQ